MSNAKTKQIGFPAPLLGEENLRLDVLHFERGLLALNRPAGVLVSQHPWYSRLPTLTDGINEQLKAGKPELLRLGLKPTQTVRGVISMDPQIAGVALLASHHDAAEYFRNIYGSGLMTLVFTFAAKGGPSGDTCDCDLPIAQHVSKPFSLVSHQTGKQSETRFRRIERLGYFSLWEAEVNYYRPEQLPLHANERSISIIGDPKYSREPLVYLSHLKRDWSGDPEKEQPLYDHMAACLTEIRIPDGPIIKAEIPKRMQNLIRQLRNYA